MKNKKIVLILVEIILIVVIISFPTFSRAGIWSDIFGGADGFVSKGDIQVDDTKLKDASDSIYFILLYVAIAAAVIVGAILGIQFMLASAEDKAKVKEQLIPYVAGCAIGFGAFAIWRLAVVVLNNVV